MLVLSGTFVKTVKPVTQSVLLFSFWNVFNDFCNFTNINIHKMLCNTHTHTQISRHTVYDTSICNYNNIYTLKNPIQFIDWKKIDSEKIRYDGIHNLKIFGTFFFCSHRKL